MFFNDEEVERAYNRFVNLDSIEDRIIYYLINKNPDSMEKSTYVENIRRLILYSDAKALVEDAEHPSPTFEQIYALVETEDPQQDNKRIFRSPFLGEAITADGSMIRVYVDRIIPKNALRGGVNIAIEIITHFRNSTIINPLYDSNGNIINPTEEYPPIMYKNRVTVLLKNIIALLNGADVAGIGRLEFNGELNRLVNSTMGLWNNRNYYGQKLIMTCEMSGVS